MRKNFLDTGINIKMTDQEIDKQICIGNWVMIISALIIAIIGILNATGVI